MLRVWNLSLLIATFSLTILGTFLTRSGVLDSVHSFTESTIGPLLLAFFGVVVAVGVGLIGWRGDQLRAPGSVDSPVSREGAFLFNNLLFAAFAFVVLLGTVFPLVVEAINGDRISVGRPYFDRMTGPIGLALLFLMAVAPALAVAQGVERGAAHPTPDPGVGRRPDAGVVRRLRRAGIDAVARLRAGRVRGAAAIRQLVLVDPPAGLARAVRTFQRRHGRAHRRGRDRGRIRGQLVVLAPGRGPPARGRVEGGARPPHHLPRHHRAQVPEPHRADRVGTDRRRAGLPAGAEQVPVRDAVHRHPVGAHRLFARTCTSHCCRRRGRATGLS